MGIVKKNIGKDEEALLYFEKTESLEKNNQINIFYKAQVYYNLKMLPEAKNELEKLLKFSVQDSKIYYLLGLINQKLKNNKEAH